MRENMAENLTKRPHKGILKSSTSFEQQEAEKRLQDIKWDEMNILQTLHPPDKDYGHMKIEEPKTPYNYYSDELDAGSDKELHALDAEVLAKKIALGSEQLPKALINDEEDESEEEEENETEEEREKRKAFESKRKSHYNEFYAVKLARKLMQQDTNEDDDKNSEDSDTHGHTERGQNSNSLKNSNSPARTETVE